MGREFVSWQSRREKLINDGAPIPWKGPPGFSFDLKEMQSQILHLPTSPSYPNISVTALSKILPDIFVRAATRARAAGLDYHSSPHPDVVAAMVLTALLTGEKRSDLGASQVLIASLVACNHEVGDWWELNRQPREFYQEELTQLSVSPDEKLLADILLCHGATSYPSPAKKLELKAWQEFYMQEMPRRAATGEVLAIICTLLTGLDYASQCADSENYPTAGLALASDFRKKGINLPLVGPMGLISVSPEFYAEASARMLLAAPYLPQALAKSIDTGLLAFHSLAEQTALLLGRERPQPIKLTAKY